MAGHPEAARQVLETFFGKSSQMNGVDGSPIHQEAKNLYRELSADLEIRKRTH